VPVETSGQVRHERFTGPHPSGTVGYHIHTLDPAGRGRLVWHVGYQDVLAIGHLLATGTLDDERVVALAGPAVAQPRLLRVPVGASTAEIVAGELTGEDVRVLSGSVLAGREAEGDVLGFLGRYHRQIAVLQEGRRRDLLGWAGPGLERFSALRVFLSTLVPAKRFAFTTSTNGSPRAIIPVGLYERVMPFDLQPTYLLKALVTRDVERAEQLGCLELDEEDLALCTFVCPGKNDYGPHLREVLSLIEKEG
jgi:Na+-transporting NADH:ubiquinone oxidoreductase subunit A